MIDNSPVSITLGGRTALNLAMTCRMIQEDRKRLPRSMPFITDEQLAEVIAAITGAIREDADAAVRRGEGL
jgi:hypothetical protein